jgi:uncharacterized protein involved in exopolysaccharide biosynthesis
MEEKKNNIEEEKEIDLLALANKIWANRKFILKTLGVGLVIGLIVAFSIPKEYTTSVVLMPEAQVPISSSMSSLATLAGINLQDAAGMDLLALPDLYPDVLKSTPFLRGLFDVNVLDTQNNIDTTLYAYMNDFQRKSWWSYIVKVPSLLKKVILSSEDSIQANSRFMSKEELDVIEDLNDRFTVSSDKKTGVTTIQITMQSPEISAFLADSLTSYLQTYIIDYRTRKARNDLEYSEKLYEESRINYYKAQKDLATYIDGNLSIVSATYQTTQDRLQNEANLAYSLYNQMAQQLQMAKVKVQNTTPVFTIIQPAVQPLEPSKPSKKIILIGFMFLATVGGSVWVLRKDLKELIS